MNNTEKPNAKIRRSRISRKAGLKLLVLKRLLGKESFNWGSSNGRTTAFGAVYRGSNPCLQAERSEAKAGMRSLW